MNQLKIFIPIIPKKTKLKYSGINLINLMIGSALGLFVISIIIKFFITVNNNVQLIKAYTELDQSARIIEDFFSNIFNANGFGITDIEHNINTYFIFNNQNNAEFTMWYTGGTDSAVSCSGRVLTIDPNVIFPITIFLGNYIPAIGNTPAKEGYLTCKNNYHSENTASSILDAKLSMPLIGTAQIFKFFISPIVYEQNFTNMQKYYKFIPMNITNVPATSQNPSITNASIGIKINILLKSRQQVFNINKTTTFNNILNINDFNFTVTDKYLYKLITIIAPFSNNINPLAMRTSVTILP